jgi:hypothetical protein
MLVARSAIRKGKKNGVIWLDGEGVRVCKGGWNCD